MTAMPVIAHSRPTLEADDEQAVLRVLRSGHIAQGKQVAAFEQQMARYMGVPGGVATSSGTAALHLALLALGVQPGDEVALPSYVCTAPLYAIQYLGATPLLVDIDPATYNIDVADLQKKRTQRTKAVIVPHLFGLPAALAALLATGLPIVEDCAQALGATYHGQPVGSFGALAICSFYATKVLTTGEGGMVLSHTADYLEQARQHREYDEMPASVLRYNYKMTDLQAALGVTQLHKLPRLVQRRQALAVHYSRRLQAHGMAAPHVPTDCSHIFYRFVVQVEHDLEPLLERLAAAGITCRRPVFRPLHHYWQQSACPVTEQVWQRAISLPIYPTLSMDAVDRVVDRFVESLT